MKKIRQQFADLMLEVGTRDKKLVVLVGDISHGILQPFAKKCPTRYYNIGICEPSIVNMAAGLSKSGLNPVVRTNLHHVEYFSLVDGSFPKLSHFSTNSDNDQFL